MLCHIIVCYERGII